MATVLDSVYVCTLVIDICHSSMPTQYWKDPGVINRRGLVSNIHTDRFLAILSIIVQAAFSFQGMELVAM